MVSAHRGSARALGATGRAPRQTHTTMHAPACSTQSCKPPVRRSDVEHMRAAQIEGEFYNCGREFFAAATDETRRTLTVSSRSSENPAWFRPLGAVEDAAAHEIALACARVGARPRATSSCSSRRSFLTVLIAMKLLARGRPAGRATAFPRVPRLLRFSDNARPLPRIPRTAGFWG